MGFKNDVAMKAAEFEESLANLKGRVGALETLANSLRTQGMPASVQGTTRADYTARRDVSDAAVNMQRDPIDGASVRRNGVDYGAVAFGLSEIKRKITDNFGNADAVAREHRGAVQYFSDVFAKSDPAFDAAEFARLANA